MTSILGFVLTYTHSSIVISSPSSKLVSSLHLLGTPKSLCLSCPCLRCTSECKMHPPVPAIQHSKPCHLYVISKSSEVVIVVIFPKHTGHMPLRLFPAGHFTPASFLQHPSLSSIDLFRLPFYSSNSVCFIFFIAHKIGFGSNAHFFPSHVPLRQPLISQSLKLPGFLYLAKIDVLYTKALQRAKHPPLFRLPDKQKLLDFSYAHLVK